MIMGFVFGGLTILLYTKYGVLTKEQVGLTKTIIDFSQLAVAFSSLGLLPVLYKFHPYYNDNLPKNKNELFTIVIVGCVIGFTIFSIIGYFIKPIIVKKYSTNSPLVVDYYPYLYVFALGMLLFSVFESLAYVKHRSTVSNFLKETVLRFITVLLLLVYLFTKSKSFNTFILLYSLQFFLLFTILYFYLKRKGELHFHFKISRVTKKFWKKMLSMQSLLFSSLVVTTLATVIDAFVLGAKKGGSTVGDFSIAQYGANFVSVPQKAIIGGSIGLLTIAWKNKNFSEINRIYSRSCINLSLMTLFLFGNIWLNAIPLIDFLKIDPTWKLGMNTMFFICVARVIDASTGVNNLILGTSTFWQFDYITGIILLAIRIPTSFYFIGKFGLIGSAYSDVLSMLVYNFIRYEYLRRKFNMQPFNYKNVLAIILAVLSYFIAFYSCNNFSGFIGIILRAMIFSALMIIGIFALNLTPDASQLWDKWIKGIKK